jgi:hypothetical protein
MQHGPAALLLLSAAATAQPVVWEQSAVLSESPFGEP